MAATAAAAAAATAADSAAEAEAGLEVVAATGTTAGTRAGAGAGSGTRSGAGVGTGTGAGAGAGAETPRTPYASLNVTQAGDVSTRPSLGSRRNQPARPNLAGHMSVAEAAQEAAAMTATAAEAAAAVAGAGAAAAAPRTSGKAPPAIAVGIAPYPSVGANGASAASLLPGLSMLTPRASSAPGTTTPPPPKVGTTGGNATTPRHPAVAPTSAPAPAPAPGAGAAPPLAPSLAPAPAPSLADPPAPGKASQSTMPSAPTIGAGDAEPCAETRRTLRRRAILRQARKAALGAKPIKRQNPRATRARWKAILSSAAKDSRRQTRREELGGKREDEVPAALVVKRVRGSHHIASTLRVVRKACREDAFRWKACISGLRAKEVSPGRGRERT